MIPLNDSNWSLLACPAHMNYDSYFTGGAGAVAGHGFDRTLTRYSITSLTAERRGGILQTALLMEIAI